MVFREGGQFIRCHIDAKDFEKWRADTHTLRYPKIPIHTLFGSIEIGIPIIATMNGFVYDKIVESFNLPSLRNRMEFSWDINESPRILATKTRGKEK